MHHLTNYRTSPLKGNAEGEAHPAWPQQQFLTEIIGGIHPVQRTIYNIGAEDLDFGVF